MALTDISTIEVNDLLVESLERALAQAKEGTLQSVVLLKKYKGEGSLGHMWSLSKYHTPTAFLGEFVYFQHIYVEWVRNLMDEQGLCGSALHKENDPYAS